MIESVTVDIIKGNQKLSFTINHEPWDGGVTHTPVNFNFYKYLEERCKFNKPEITKLENN